MNRLPKSDVRSLIVLSLVVLATGVPFLNRAFFVDDYYFVTMAQGIRENPWRPYDFKSDDAGYGNVAWERGQLPRMVNPPLLHYYLAGVMSMFGGETKTLRTSYLLFSFISLFCMYFLGKRFVADPFLPTVLMAVCPVYWLTSYSLLIDGMLLAFILMSFHAFVVAHEKKSVGWVLSSGILMGLTILVKYVGVLIIALALLWHVIDPKRRKWNSALWAFACALVLQILWAYWNFVTYGQSHLLAAMGRGFTSYSPILLAQKSLVVLSFVGGGILFVQVGWAMLCKKSSLWLFAMVALAGALYLLLTSDRGGFEPTQAALLSIFVSGAGAFLVGLSLIFTSHKPSGNIMFLLLWIVLGLLELIIVMPWTAGRYLLSVLPAMAWLFALAVQNLKWQVAWRPVIGVTAVLSVLIAHGDYSQANTIVKLSERLASRKMDLEAMSPPRAHRWYYLSDTFDGSQPYLAPLGWQNALPGQSFKKDDLFMRAFYRRSSWWNVEEELKKFEPVVTFEMRSKNPFRTMDIPASAGFYASAWGALPWTLTTHPLESYELYQAVTE